MAERHCWIRLPLIDGMHAQIRAEHVVAIAPADAFHAGQVEPGAAGGCVVSVGSLLLRASGTVDEVTSLVLGATA